MRNLAALILIAMAMVSIGATAGNAAEQKAAYTDFAVVPVGTKLDPSVLFSVQREYRFRFDNGNTGVITYRPDGTRSVSSEQTSWGLKGIWRAQGPETICTRWDGKREGCQYIVHRGDGKVMFVGVESGNKAAILTPK